MIVLLSPLTCTPAAISVTVRQGSEAARMEEGEAPSERTHTPARLELRPALCTLTSSCLTGRGER